MELVNDTHMYPPIVFPLRRSGVKRQISLELVSVCPPHRVNQSTVNNLGVINPMLGGNNGRSAITIFPWRLGCQGHHVDRRNVRKLIVLSYLVFRIQSILLVKFLQRVS